MMQINPNYGFGQQRSSIFRGIKIMFIVIQILNIIGSIILITFGFIAIGTADTQTKEDPQVIRTAGIIVVLSGVIPILLIILGLFGAIKENFSLIVTYGVIIGLISIGNFAVHSWVYAVVNLIVAIIAFYFAYLIKKEVVGHNMA